MKRTCLLTLSLFLFLTACSRGFETLYYSYSSLASFTENRVEVEIFLVVDQDGAAWLEALFTPEEGYHLYGKDIPRNGVGGLGRPTLLELVPGSRLEAAGGLTESVPAVEDEDCEGLLAYPQGPVTLRLPIRLPAGEGWYDERVLITYMACRGGVCSPPVVSREVAVQVPGNEELPEQ